MNDQGKGEIRAERDKTEGTLKTKGERTLPSRSSNAAEVGVQRPATQRALAGQSPHAEKGDRVHLGTRLDTEMECFPLWLKATAPIPFPSGVKQLKLVTSFPGNTSARLQEIFPQCGPGRAHKL